jgi:hypothetical protein
MHIYGVGSLSDGFEVIARLGPCLVVVEEADAEVVVVEVDTITASWRRSWRRLMRSSLRKAHRRRCTASGSRRRCCAVEEVAQESMWLSSRRWRQSTEGKKMRCPSMALRRNTEVLVFLS